MVSRDWGRASRANHRSGEPVVFDKGRDSADERPMEGRCKCGYGDWKTGVDETEGGCGKGAVGGGLKSGKELRKAGFKRQ